MSTASLPDKIGRIDDALVEVPHAFGGAIALAYWAEPRATVDIDLNVFVEPDDAARVLDPLGELGIEVGAAADVIDRDGQARVWWDDTPVDLFFAYDRFHRAAARAAVVVPFADRRIAVLSATHLAVCKVVFDRPKDWVDIDAMIELGTSLDAPELLKWAGRVCGDEDPRFVRIASVLSR